MGGQIGICLLVCLLVEQRHLCVPVAAALSSRQGAPSTAAVTAAITTTAATAAVTAVTAAITTAATVTAAITTRHVW